MRNERAKHRTFTSMAQRRRWIALQDDVVRLSEIHKQERSKDEEANDNPEDQAGETLSRPSGQYSSGS